MKWLWPVAHLPAAVERHWQTTTPPHFVELHSVVSASSLCGVSGNRHDKEQRRCSPAQPCSSRSQVAPPPSKSGHRARSEHRAARRQHGSSPSGAGHSRRTGNRRRRPETPRIGDRRHPARGYARCADVRATGATSITELLSIGPGKSGARKAGAASGPCCCSTASAFRVREMRDIPTEAIKRVEILPRKSARRSNMATAPTRRS